MSSGTPKADTCRADALCHVTRKRPVIHAAFWLDACAWPVGRHRHGRRSSIRLGEAHPDTGASYNNVAFNLNAQKRYPEAEPFFRKSLEIRIAALGEAHPDTGQSYNNVAANLHAQGRYAEAEPLFEQAIAISETTLSAN